METKEDLMSRESVVMAIREFERRLAESTDVWAMGHNGIPEYMHQGLLDYVRHGLAPGHFLWAVLSNDLMEAFGRADPNNRDAMQSYVMFLYNIMPGGSHGSDEKVMRWVRSHEAMRAEGSSDDDV
jgi:hypothetical protein